MGHNNECTLLKYTNVKVHELFNKYWVVLFESQWRQLVVSKKSTYPPSRSILYTTGPLPGSIFGSQWWQLGNVHNITKPGPWLPCNFQNTPSSYSSLYYMGNFCLIFMHMTADKHIFTVHTFTVHLHMSGALLTHTFFPYL